MIEARRDAYDPSMKLWIMKAIDPVNATRTFPPSKWSENEYIVKRWTWDCSYEFVVRAETESEARELASSRHGEEGPDAWTDPTLTSCFILTEDGPAEVVLRDFLAG